MPSLSPLWVGLGGERLAPAGGSVDKHAPWGLFFLDSLIGSAVGAEPVTCAWTLRWAPLPFRAGTLTKLGSMGCYREKKKKSVQ